MKKLLLFVFAIFALNSYAGNASLFDLNEDALENEFSKLSTLEAVVVADPTFSIGSIEEECFAIEALQQSADANIAQSSFSFQWDGFLWGFCCCPVGLFVIATNNNKTKDQKTSYWIGVGGVVVRNVILIIVNTSFAVVSASSY